MNKEKPFWESDFIILLRWILFLPIGFILAGTLQAMPPLVVGLVKANIPESTFLAIVSTVILVPILIALSCVWFMSVLMTPYLNCGFIAPNNRIPAIIYGMLFCLFEGIFLISIFAGGTSWIFIVYQLIFSAITLGGIVMLSKEIEFSRVKRWMRRGASCYADVRTMMSRTGSPRRPV